MRLILFHPEVNIPNVLNTYKETESAIKNITVDFVETTQMCFLNTSLFDNGFEFIVVCYEAPYDNIIIRTDDSGEIYCPNYNGTLTKDDDLFSLWRRGRFSHFCIDNSCQACGK